MARRTFRLLKNSIEFKKGTLVQEACDDGDQHYNVLNIEKAMLFDDWELYFNDPSCSFSRDTIEKQPKVFEEVFSPAEMWLTKEQFEQYTKFISKKGK